MRSTSICLSMHRFSYPSFSLAAMNFFVTCTINGSYATSQIKTYHVCLEDDLLISDSLLNVDLFHGCILLTFLINRLLACNLNPKTFFNLFLMSITSIKQLSCFLCGDVCQLLCPLLFIGESLNAVLQSPVPSVLFIEG